MASCPIRGDMRWRPGGTKRDQFSVLRRSAKRAMIGDAGQPGLLHALLRLVAALCMHPHAEGRAASHALLTGDRQQHTSIVPRRAVYGLLLDKAEGQRPSSHLPRPGTLTAEIACTNLRAIERSRDNDTRTANL
jgi:hypothetical protein